MRIVNRAEFLTLPAGTVFAEWAPDFFGDLRVKTDSLPNDWLYVSLVDAVDASNSDERDMRMRVAQHGGEARMEYGISARDGAFADDQLYGVWSDEDVRELIDTLISWRATKRSQEKG